MLIECVRCALVRSARAAGALALAALLGIGAFAAPSSAVTPYTYAGAWALTGWRRVPAGHADQGIATVSLPGGRTRTVTRGNRDVPGALRDAGWWHVGDPGSAGGWLVDAYQGVPALRAKLFVVTAPDGARSAWVHRLAPGEMINSSFAAVAPSGHWFVSGGWGTVDRLLVFPMPGANPLARAGHNLPLATTLRLTRPVRDVQGCTFASPTDLVCSTDDPDDDLFGVPRQLLSIRLPRPLDGRPMAAIPVLLGAVPQVSGCGVAETEGIDAHAGRLRVVAHEPGWCGGWVDVFTYRLRRTAARALPAAYG